MLTLCQQWSPRLCPSDHFRGQLCGQTSSGEAIIGLWRGVEGRVRDSDALMQLLQ